MKLRGHVAALPLLVLAIPVQARASANTLEEAKLASQTAPEPVFPPQHPGAAFRDCHDCPEMVVLPPGSFVMGSSDEERGTLGVFPMFDAMEEPRHEVLVGDSFAVGRYEVTFAQWDACLADGGCNGYRPDDAGLGRGQRPVINVNFADAQSYVDWLSLRSGETYRLPSEAEWAYAARAARQTWYPFSNQLSETDAKAGHVLDRTTPVGSYAANAFGLHDVIGNVAEWTADCHHETYVGAPSDGSAWLTGSDCTHRNVRG